jgi:hypothetical protein
MSEALRCIRCRRPLGLTWPGWAPSTDEPEPPLVCEGCITREELDGDEAPAERDSAND